ncbi:MAG: ATP-binding protein [Betaproteobacteria bacterium]|nr:ATP-binding protein [Betaproteobacteria bacterium]
MSVIELDRVETAPVREVQAPKLSFFRTLRFRLMLSVALVHAVLMGAFVWSAVNQQSAAIRAELRNRAHSLITLMAVASTNALLAEDLGSLAEVTARVKRQPDVINGAILDVRGDVLASTDAQQVGHYLRIPPRGSAVGGLHRLELEEQVRVAGQRVGTVLLGMSTRHLQSELAATRDEGLLFILLALVVGSVAAWGVSLLITRNLYTLMTAVRRIGRGNLGVRVDLQPNDEVGLLGGAFNAMAESLQRISEQAQSEHQRRTDAERLACVGELSASIAHEIRNPLSAVINSVKLLDRPDLPASDRAQSIAILNTESLRLQRILNDFLDFARIRESRLVTGDLSALIEEVAALIRQHPHAGTVKVDIQCDVRPCLVRHDPDQLRQVIWNLMLNGVQAMPEGGQLQVRVRCRARTARVSVTDTGCGIPVQLLDKIVRPFVTGRKQGTGLGLSIAQRILMQHGTTLSILSHVNVGTEMSFDLEVA